MHFSSMQLAQRLSLGRATDSPDSPNSSTVRPAVSDVAESPVAERYAVASPTAGSPPDPSKLAGLRFDVMA